MINMQEAWNQRLKLRAECDKLWAEGNKLWAEADKLWAEAILAVHGNVIMEWKIRDGDYDCIVEGVIYKHSEDTP